MHKKRAVLRPATFDDIVRMLEIEWACWDDSTPRATAEQFRARIEAFPEGQLVSILNGEMVGLVNTMIVSNYDIRNPIPTWDQVTNGGLVKGAHSDKGNVVYGVNMSCLPDAPMGIGTQMLIKIGTIVISRGLRWCVIGGRMPDYHKYKDQYTPEEYLNVFDGDGRHIDRGIQFYLHVKGVRIEGVLPDYMVDPESCDNAVLLVWYNPFFRFPRFTHKWLSHLMSFMV